MSKEPCSRLVRLSPCLLGISCSPSPVSSTPVSC